MNKLKLNQFNGITEFKNELKSDDIKIWIYTLQVKDLDKKHKENYDNIKTGLYNLQTAYYAVIRKDENQDSNTRKLLNAMKSERGQNVAKEAGYVQNY